MLVCVDTQEPVAVDPITSSFAAAIRAEMGAQDLSVPQLAALVGMHRNTLLNYLRSGQEREMTITTLVKIAEALNVPYEDLIARADVLRQRLGN